VEDLRIYRLPAEPDGLKQGRKTRPNHLRIFTAALATETNTFSPICVDRRAFEASLYAPPGQHPETPTLCTAPITVGRRVTAEKGWELIEGTAAWADPAGLVNRQAYEGLRDEILDRG